MVLFKYDKNMNTVGDLAESWDISANGLIITFRLRKGGILGMTAALYPAADVLLYLSGNDRPEKLPLLMPVIFIESKKGRSCLMISLSGNLSPALCTCSD